MEKDTVVEEPIGTNLSDMVLCVDCENIYNPYNNRTMHKGCPSCTSQQFIPLRRILNQEQLPYREKS